MKKDLKNKYKKMFAELTDIVNSIDPAGLIRIDAPDDEYSFEITDILSGLK